VVHRCRFMGLNAIQNALMSFKDVKVPKENIIWGLGKGLRLALITLNAGRLGLPAGCIGGARKSLQISREWGNERKQWGAPIGYHEASAEKISNMTADLFAMEAITWMSGAWEDFKSHDIRLEAAMAKVFCSEHSHKIIEDTVQLRGGRGYERASSLQARGEKPIPVEKMLRDSRINMIVEGTSEILRLFIAREALDRHLKIAGDVLNSKLGLGKRVLAAMRAGVYYAGWYPFQWLGSLFTFMYWPRFSSLGKMGAHLRFASRTSHRLARTIFHLMLLNGPKLEKRQLHLSRVVDIATDLFAIAAVVGRSQAKSLRSPDNQHMTEIAHLFCLQARDRIRLNFRALRSNHDSIRKSITREVLKGDLQWLEEEAVFQHSQVGSRKVDSPAAARDQKDLTELQPRELS